MILGKKTTLRALEDRDNELLRQWRNHPELMPCHFSDFPVAEADQRRWYESYAQRTDQHIFIVEDEQKNAVGYTLLKNIDHKNRNAEIGIYLDPKAQGKGFGKDAFLTLMRFCFAELNMHRLYLMVAEFNQHAIRLYEHLGFQHEGRFRQCHFSQNAYHDIIIMSILEDEFSQLEK